MFVSPMFLHKTGHPFHDHQYITKFKLDGFMVKYNFLHNR
jgi:hypothetical protein